MSIIPQKKRKRLHTRGRNRSPRPKTFQSEKAAQAYAEAQGIRAYSLVFLKDGTRKKIRIVPK
ncbi:hypothetical protein JXB02_05465 [Candidatus Woesearchaeota archaeon]|nr:hypothetical protein [Candidatus Woesearchaeota archaeon]